MLNIAFYQCNRLPDNDQGNHLFLGVAALYLRTYIDTQRPELAKQLHWELPLQLGLTDQELVDYCWHNQIDVLGVSMFVWNQEFIEGQIARIRHLLPQSIKIVAGGGSVIPHKDSEYLQHHPWMDYAVYGSGEVAFADILQNILSPRPLIKFNSSNMAWRDAKQGVTVTAEYRYVPEPVLSPYLHCQDMLKQMVDQEHSRGFELELPYQLTRGCPYRCTFCDWNNGPLNKTSRRSGSFQQEIDLFQQLGIKKLDITDANTGQYPEDIEMFQYLAAKNLQQQAGFTLNFNLSKLKKKANLELLRIAGQGNLIDPGVGFVFAVQDIDTTVLANIDRPDVSWQVHQEMIQEMRTSFPHLPVRLQLIQGLPGQTLQTWQHTLCEVAKTDAVTWIYINELLPLSPAGMDEQYQKRFAVEYSNSQRWSGDYVFQNQFPQSCYSYNSHDFVQMTVLSHVFTAVYLIQHNAKVKIDTDAFLAAVLGSQHYHNMCEDLYHNWITNDQFWFTHKFGGGAAPDNKFTACRFDVADAEWSVNSHIIKIMMQCTPNIEQHWSKFIKYLQSTKQNTSGLRSMNIAPLKNITIFEESL